ncbi:MAG: hypothetical protein ACRDVM_00770 [Acidimicrobiia bacterium]
MSNPSSDPSPSGPPLPREGGASRQGLEEALATLADDQLRDVVRTLVELAQALEAILGPPPGDDERAGDDDRSADIWKSFGRVVRSTLSLRPEQFLEWGSKLGRVPIEPQQPPQTLAPPVDSF